MDCRGEWEEEPPFLGRQGYGGRRTGSRRRRRPLELNERFELAPTPEPRRSEVKPAPLLSCPTSRAATEGETLSTRPVPTSLLWDATTRHPTLSSPSSLSLAPFLVSDWLLLRATPPNASWLAYASQLQLPPAPLRTTLRQDFSQGNALPSEKAEIHTPVLITCPSPV